MTPVGLSRLGALIIVAAGVCHGLPIVDLVPSTNFTFVDPTAGDTITISSGPVESGFSTLSIASSFNTIDIANKVNVFVDDGSGGDTFVVDFAALSTGLTELTLNGGNGADTFMVTPAGVPITVNGGGNPQPAPGNVLTLDFSGTTGANLSQTSTVDGFQGSWTFTNESAVNFGGIQTVNEPTPEPRAIAMIAFGLVALLAGAGARTRTAAGKGALR